MKKIYILTRIMLLQLGVILFLSASGQTHTITTGDISIDTDSTLLVKAAEATSSVKETETEQNNNFAIYPNPFSTSTTIRFTLEKRANVKLKIYNLFGQEVKVLVDEELPEGVHRIRWNGTKRDDTAATAGIYICRLIKNGEVSNVQRLIIQR